MATPDQEPITKDVLITGIPLDLYLRAIKLKEIMRCDNWRVFLQLAVERLEGGQNDD